MQADQTGAVNRSDRFIQRRTKIKNHQPRRDPIGANGTRIVLSRLHLFCGLFDLWEPERHILIGRYVVSWFMGFM